MTETPTAFLSTSKNQMRLFWLAVMSAAVFFRFVNLGQLGLWGDEGYSALSAQAILNDGYPRLPSGGIYPRSLAFLYFEALSVKIFGLNEFALRFPPAIMGLLAILISYKLSNHLLGKHVALVVTVLMSFSSWELEFSRNARMYTFFQFFFLLSIYVFYRGFVEGEKRYQWLIFPVWIFTLFTHQLSITLMAILIIPLFLKNVRPKKKWILLPGLLLFALLWVVGNRLQRYLRFGGISQNPPGAGSGGGGKLPVAIPQTDLLEALVSGASLAGFISISLVISIGIFLIFQSLKRDKHSLAYLYLILMLTASSFNQVALTLVFLVGYTLLFFKDLKSWKEKPFLIACAISVSGFFFWLFVGIFHGFQLNKTLSLILQYPYLKDRFLKYYLPGWPLEMLLAGLGLLLLWKSAILYRKKEVIFSSLVFIGPVLLLGFSKPSDNSARYSFHLFPLLLMFEAYALVYLGQKSFFKKKWVIVPVFVFVIFFVLGDTRLSNLENIINRNYGDSFERPIPMSRKSYFLYPDYQSTSYYIKSNMSEGDLVISMREVIPFFYIQKIDYIWIGSEAAGFAPSLSDTNAEIISSAGIYSLLSDDKTRKIWFLSDPFRVAKLKKIGVQDSLSFLEHISDCMVHRGEDGYTTVYLISSDKNCLSR